MYNIYTNCYVTYECLRVWEEWGYHSLSCKVTIMLGSQKALVYFYRMIGFYYHINLIFKLVFASPGKNTKFPLWSWKLLGDPKQ